MSSEAEEISLNLPETIQSIPAALESLPDELLSSIFLHLDDFVFPPLSKRFLPFHRAQLYRKVSLDLHQFRIFRSSLQRIPSCAEFVEEVTLKHVGFVNTPSLEAENDFIWSPVNLKSLTFVADEERRDQFTVTTQYFEQNPKLEIVRLTSSFQRYTAQNGNVLSLDVFDPKQVGVVTEEEVESVFRCIDLKDPRFPESETLFELEREERGLTGCSVRYFGIQGKDGEDESYFYSICKLPIRKLQIVCFDRRPLIETLGHLPRPELLQHLSLHSLGHTLSSAGLGEYLVLFPNLTHLSLGATSLPNDLDFYDTLDILSLEYFHVGRRAILHIQPLLEALIGVRESNLSKLKELVLDNLDADLPSRVPRAVDSFYWPSPFPQECSYEQLEQLVLAAENLGIELKGSTLDAVRLEELIQKDKIRPIRPLGRPVRRLRRLADRNVHE
ncbi:hypothetical protein JCM5350_001248 [Sporobolomyces pararoseus]